MSQKHPPQKTICPFWERKSLSCSACKSGLHIPLNDHIEKYCTSPNHPTCPIYCQYTTSQLHPPGSAGRTQDNRRKSPRYILSNKVILTAAGKNRNNLEDTTEAITLDLSEGGMRLTTKKPLINDTSLQFSFDGNFPEELQSGTGVVTWCNLQIDKPGYQAGIRFKDNNTHRAMKQYLIQHAKGLS